MAASPSRRAYGAFAPFLRRFRPDESVKRSKLARAAAREFFRIYLRRQDPNAYEKIALLAESHLDARAWLRMLGDRSVHVFCVDADDTIDTAYWHRTRDLGEIAEVLISAGPLDLLVDISGAGSSQDVVRMGRLLPHVRAGGLFVRQAVLRDRELDPGSVGLVREISGGSWSSPAESDLRPVRSIDVVARHNHIAVFSKTEKHYLMLRDSRADQVLPARNPGLQVENLRTIPSRKFVTRANIVSHKSSFSLWIPPTEMKLPDMHLRHYRGEIKVSSHMLTYVENTILPPSFKAPHVRELWNKKIHRLNDEFATLTRTEDELVLAGHYYDLNCAIPGHFGHFMTESVGKLWGWDEAKARMPDLKVLYFLPHPDYVPVFESSVFSAFGIAEQDITWMRDGNLILESYVSASQLWHNAYMHFAHPDMVPVWERLRTGLVKLDKSSPRKIFVSRKHVAENRFCRNLTEVESFFSSHDFEVVYPELLAPGDQATLFGNAEVIAGFGGSAMFNSLYASQLRTMIVLNHESYTARNEQLFASLLGADLHYFWSSSDTRHPTNGWSEKAFHSSWEFDFCRNETELEALVSST